MASVASFAVATAVITRAFTAVADCATAELQSRVDAVAASGGGWAQLPGMESDAYATGQTLYTLVTTTVPSERNSEFTKAIKRARSYLIRTQKQDGSWFVKSRSKPIQKFFDNGDPHGKDQFISISATSWATAALAKSRIINTQ